MAVEWTVATSADRRESWSVPATATAPPQLHDCPHSSQGERPISQPEGQVMLGRGGRHSSRSSRSPRRQLVKVARAHP